MSQLPGTFESIDGQPIEFAPYGRIKTVEQAGEVYGDACARLWADSASTTEEFRNGIVQLREALATDLGVAEFQIFAALGIADHVEELEAKYRERGNGLDEAGR
jgi:hypothetical protein